MENIDYIIEEGVLVTFGGNSEVAYEMKCFDGYAVGKLIDDAEDMPLTIRMKYPKLVEILSDENKIKEVLAYRGLYNLTTQDIHYGDIMMSYGKVMTNDYATFLNDYVRWNLCDYTAEIAVALKHIENRFPLDSFLFDKIWDCFTDYINDNDLGEDTNLEEYFGKDVEGIFFDAIDTEIK